jgi:hypothetical protein
MKYHQIVDVVYLLVAAVATKKFIPKINQAAVYAA